MALTSARSLQDAVLLARQSMIEVMLLPGEDLMHVATISPAIYWKGAIMAVVALAVLAYSAVLALLFGLVAAGLLAVGYTTRRYLLLAATDRRVIVCGGVIHQVKVQLSYKTIESVEVFRSLFGMALGYGNIILSGTGRVRFIIPYVTDAVEFADVVTQRLYEKELPPKTGTRIDQTV